MRRRSPWPRRHSGLAPSGCPIAMPRTTRPASSMPWAAALRRTARRAGSWWSWCSSLSRCLLLDLGDDVVGPGLGRHRKAEPRPAVEVALRDAAREVADAADVGGAFGHADGAARVEQVEAVGGLEQLLVGGQCQLLFHQVLRLLLVAAEGAEQEVDVAV